MARVDTAGSMTEGPLLGVIARVALPIVLANLLNVTYLLVNALWVGRLGGAAVAAVAASAPLFGVLISLGSEQLMALALIFGWLLGGRSALHLRAAHFAPDLAHMRRALRFVRIYAPFLGLFAIPQVMCGVFRGAGSTRRSMGISLTMQWVFQLPSAWLLAWLTPLGVLGVWWSYPVGNALASALAVGWFV
jgi:Na+-driven multidrug efflux pump